jgi:hypothetical protein
MKAQTVKLSWDTKLMALYEKWNEAWNNNDATAVFECFHDDFEFKFHSSGNVMKKSNMSVEMTTTMMQNEMATNQRCIYENDDICVFHQFSEFASGDKEAVMMVNLKKMDRYGELR